MTKIITSKDITAAFTNKVNEYLAKGMIFNCGTMSGSQGELGKVDLTDGKYIYRIRLDRDHLHIDNEFFYERFEAVVLIVEQFDAEGYDILDSWHTLWNGKGKLVEKMAWYSIEEKKAFTDDYDEIVKLFAIRKARRDSRETKRTEITDKTRLALILKLVQKRKGYKTVNKNAIDRVIKYDGNKYSVYFTTASRKDYLVIS